MDRSCPAKAAKARACKDQERVSSYTWGTHAKLVHTLAKEITQKYNYATSRTWLYYAAQVTKIVTLYTSMASEPLYQTYIKMTLHSMVTPYHAKKGHNLIVLPILPHLYCCLSAMSVCLENITAKLILSFFEDKYYAMSFKQPFQSGSFSQSFQLIFAKFWEQL